MQENYTGRGGVLILRLNAIGQVEVVGLQNAQGEGQVESKRALTARVGYK